MNKTIRNYIAATAVAATIGLGSLGFFGIANNNLKKENEALEQTNKELVEQNSTYESTISKCKG
jgi:L-cystine uptake protein TcyP (sodium:dicarboxylate symporter family)